MNGIYLNPLRNYRKIESFHKDEQKFQIMLEETDLLITIPKYINTEQAVEKCFQYISHLRQELKSYILIDPSFQHSLKPITSPTTAPSIVRAMCQAAKYAHVGPFAAVAGSIAQMTSLMLIAWITQENEQVLKQKTQKDEQKIQKHASKALEQKEEENINKQDFEKKFGQENQTKKDEKPLVPYKNSKPIDVIVENGGDIYLHSQKERIVGILSKPTEGESLGIKIHSGEFPVSICSSSSKIGHSLSFGNGDIAMVRAKNAALADALATAYCNMLKTSKDINKVIERAQKDAQIKIPNNPFDNDDFFNFLNEKNVLTQKLFIENALPNNGSHRNTLPQNNPLGGLEGVFLQCDGHIGAWGKIELVAL